MAKKHIFLSYCHDDETEVTKLYNDLVSAGEDIWWDKNILPGQDWKIEIKKAIKSSYAIVICFSDKSTAREKSGIYSEARDAIDEYRNLKPGSSYIFPVRFSACEIPLIEIDSYKTLDDLQYVDLFPLTLRADGLNRLLAGLKQAPQHP